MKECNFKVCRIICKLVFYLLIGGMIILYLKPSLIGKWIVEDEFISRLGTILPALIAVAGVYATVANNRRGTYKEIVTRERIDWIHDLRDSLAELMEIMEAYEVSGEKIDQAIYKKDMRKVKQLYFRIISSLNVDDKKDKKLIHIRAILSLNKYLKDKKLELPLNFKVNGLSFVYYDEGKEELEDSRNKKKFRIYELNGSSQEVISLFTIIYKDTWEDVKGEAF